MINEKPLMVTYDDHPIRGNAGPVAWSFRPTYSEVEKRFSFEERVRHVNAQAKAFGFAL